MINTGKSEGRRSWLGRKKIELVFRLTDPTALVGNLRKYPEGSQNSHVSLNDANVSLGVFIVQTSQGGPYTSLGGWAAPCCSWAAELLSMTALDTQATVTHGRCLCLHTLDESVGHWPVHVKA